MTVPPRFDCVLGAANQAVLDKYEKLKDKDSQLVDRFLNNRAKDEKGQRLGSTTTVNWTFTSSGVILTIWAPIWRTILVVYRRTCAGFLITTLYYKFGGILGRDPADVFVKPRR